MTESSLPKLAEFIATRTEPDQVPEPQHEEDMPSPAAEAPATIHETPTPAPQPFSQELASGTIRLTGQAALDRRQAESASRHSNRPPAPHNATVLDKNSGREKHRRGRLAVAAAALAVAALAVGVLKSNSSSTGSPTSAPRAEAPATPAPLHGAKHFPKLTKRTDAFLSEQPAHASHKLTAKAVSKPRHTHSTTGENHTTSSQPEANGGEAVAGSVPEAPKTGGEAVQPTEPKGSDYRQNQTSNPNGGSSVSAKSATNTTKVAKSAPASKAPTSSAEQNCTLSGSGDYWDSNGGASVVVLGGEELLFTPVIGGGAPSEEDLGPGHC